jgi:RNA polymerase primary sigma factor
MRQLKITASITNRNSESLDKYLNDVSKENLITPEQEVELAEKIRNGDSEALERLVKANLRFVISVAKQYQNQGLSLSDLICEGNIGLIKAAKRFDETKGFKFISYSVWWIRNSILQALNENSKMVKLPQNRQELLSKYNKASAKLEQILGRTPGSIEIAEEMGISKKRLDDLLKFRNDGVSLNTNVGGEESTSTLEELIENEGVPPTDQKLNDESLHHDIEEILRRLSERERYIIIHTFGLQGTQFPPERIAEELGISVERTRQLRERALIRLRHIKFSRKLKQYLAS